jgi:hypothetical protein
VPGAQAFTQGLLPPAGNFIAWEDAIGSWEDYEGSWQIILEDNRLSKLVWFAGNLVYQLPNEGIYLEGYARRIDMAFMQQDQAGAITLNRSLVKLLTRAWPELNEGSVNVLFGKALTTDSAYAWLDPKLFVCETDLHQSWTLNSKYLAVEFNNNNGEGDPYYFELTGNALEIQQRGKY